MELHAPKISIVRDAHDRAIVFVDIRFGYKETIVRVAPAFQSAVLAGGSVTVHLDTHLRRFIIASQSMKGLLKAETCHHVIDLPGQSRHSYALKAHEHVKAGENMKADKNTKAHEHIKRPKNSWIIYRSEKSKFLHKNNPGMSAGDISTMVSQHWKMEPAEVKKYYQVLADEEARQHKIKYPEYRYTPSRQ